MIGLTLSLDDIRHAPPEVRRWLERPIAEAFGPAAAAPQEPPRRLIGCTVEEGRAVLSLIQGLLPAVGVFFELGREPVAVSPQGLRALRLDDMLRHSRLQNTAQLGACLRAIDEALQQVRGEPGAALTALDGAGHCLVADVTARNILLLWQEIVAAHDLAPQNAALVPAQAGAQGEAP